MKNKWTLGLSIVALTAAFLTLGINGCSEKKTDAPKAQAEATAGPTKVVALEVDGMTCNSCEVALKTTLKKLDGVKAVEANYKENRAVVTVNPEKVADEQIVAAISKLGYTAKIQSDN